MVPPTQVRTIPRACRHFRKKRLPCPVRALPVQRSLNTGGVVAPPPSFEVACQNGKGCSWGGEIQRVNAHGTRGPVSSDELHESLVRDNRAHQSGPLPRPRIGPPRRLSPSRGPGAGAGSGHSTVKMTSLPGIVQKAARGSDQDS